MPFARSALVMSVASMESSISIVATTAERLAGSLTNGVAIGFASAQSYKMPEDSAVRAVHQSSPPLELNQSTCSAIKKMVARAGVL